jgi:hypothetical protein
MEKDTNSRGGIRHSGAKLCQRLLALFLGSVFLHPSRTWAQASPPNAAKPPYNIVFIIVDQQADRRPGGSDSRSAGRSGRPLNPGRSGRSRCTGRPRRPDRADGSGDPCRAFRTGWTADLRRCPLEGESRCPGAITVGGAASLRIRRRSITLRKPGGHDDLANACAGALTLAAVKNDGVIMGSDLGYRPPIRIGRRAVL